MQELGVSLTGSLSLSRSDNSMGKSYIKYFFKNCFDTVWENQCTIFFKACKWNFRNMIFFFVSLESRIIGITGVRWFSFFPCPTKVWLIEILLIVWCRWKLKVLYSQWTNQVFWFIKRKSQYAVVRESLN